MTNKQQLEELSQVVNARFQHMLLTMELGSDRQFREAKSQWEAAEKAMREFRDKLVFNSSGMPQQWNQQRF